MMLHSYQTSQCHYEVQYLGPPLEEGPLPAVFYFALSAKDSLTLDPFNQPILPFLSHPIRIFSITLPGHEYPLKKEEAIKFWKKQLIEKEPFLTLFFDEVSNVIRELIEKKIISPNHLGVMGLSRGSFAALHVAARIPELRTLVLFSPMIAMEKISELESLPETLIETYSLEKSLETLSTRNMQFFIGNADTRVDTKTTISFFEKLCGVSQKNGIRYPPLELHILQSIGYKGHGTGKETFTKGATWLKNALLHK